MSRTQCSLKPISYVSEPQLPFALRAVRKALKSLDESRSILRICWEWNGARNEKLVSNAVNLSLVTGGNAKFDLKYTSPVLSEILSGVSNKQAFRNFERSIRKCFIKFPPLSLNE